MTPPGGLRLFLSSTFSDLREERSLCASLLFPEIRALCRSRGLPFREVDLRWGLTDEEVAQGEVIRTCLEEIDRSLPWFVGITGDRYGHVPPLHEISRDPDLLERFPWVEDAAIERASIVELEFRQAIQRTPKEDREHLLFYFRNGTGHAPDERLLRLQQWVEGEGIRARRFSTPDELLRLVRSDLLRLLGEHLASRGGMGIDSHAAVASMHRAAVVPSARLIARLDRHLEEESAPLAIAGPPGCGKSAALAHWAGHVRRRHPEVIVIEHYVDAEEGGTAMMSRLSRQIARALDREWEPPMPGELEPTFVNWLLQASDEIGSRVLLVIDGLDRLLDGGCAGFPPIASRQLRVVASIASHENESSVREGGWQRHPMDLPTAEEREAIVIRYLREYRKKLPTRLVRRLAGEDLCRLPLPLTLLLEELRLIPGHDQLEQGIDELLGRGGEVSLLALPLERLERELGPALAGRMLAAIAITPGGASTEELQAFSGCDASAVSRLMLQLEAHLLVGLDGRLSPRSSLFADLLSQRYLPGHATKRRFEEEMVEVLRGLAPTRNRSLAEVRLLERLERIAEAFERLTEPALFAAVAVSEGDQPLLALWQRLAPKGDAGREPVRRLVAATATEGVGGIPPLPVARFLRLAGFWQEAIPAAQRVVDLARASDDHGAELMALRLLAELHLLRGEGASARQWLERQRLLARAERNVRCEVEALLHLGEIAVDQGDEATAFASFTEAAELAGKIADHTLRALVDLSHGTAHLEMGRLDDALPLLRRALERFTSVGDRRACARTLGQIGLVHWRRGEHGEAMRCYREEMASAAEAHDRLTETMAVGKIGLAHQQRGEDEEGLRCFERYRELAEELGYARGLGYALGNIGTIHRDRGDRVTAADLLQRAADIHGAAGHLPGRLLWLLELGRVELDRAWDREGGSPRAVLEEGLELARRLGRDDLACEAAEMLATLDALEGRQLEAWPPSTIDETFPLPTRGALTYERTRRSFLRREADLPDALEAALRLHRELYERTPTTQLHQRIEQLEQLARISSSRSA